MERRYFGIFHRLMLLMLRPPTDTLPEVGFSSRRISLINVLFPAPDAPTMKTNSPSSIFRSTSLSATVPLEYFLLTWLNSINV